MEIAVSPLIAVLIILGGSSFGFVTHVLMKLADLRDADPTITLTKYFSRNPYRTVGKLLTVVGAAIALAEPNITPMVITGAVGIGYAADSAGNRFKS